MSETTSNLDPNWCAWFGGLCDGEAHFGIGTRGSPSVSVALRCDDRDILFSIQKTLGGSITFEDRTYSRIKGKNERDLCRWRQYGPDCLNSVQAIELGLSGSWNHWFAGFCDGEASFNITKCGSMSVKISLREDDSTVLYEIQEKLGVGSIHTESFSKARDSGKDSKNVIRWRVCGPYNCLVVVNALEGKMRSKKAKDFEIWAEAVRASLAIGKQRSKLRRPMMLEYKRKLEQARTFKHFEEGTK